jgi:hypothetical protein
MRRKIRPSGVRQALDRQRVLLLQFELRHRAAGLLARHQGGRQPRRPGPPRGTTLLDQIDHALGRLAAGRGLDRGLARVLIPGAFSR